MASQLKDAKLADTPKPKRSPPPPPPPPRVNGGNSPSLRGASPAGSSCNGHLTQQQYASSWRGSTTGSTTSSYNTATTCCHSCHHHHQTHANHHHIHNNNTDHRCQSISSSASAHGGYPSYNQMCCNQMVCSKAVCRKLVEMQQSHHYNSNISLAPTYRCPSSSMSSALSHSSLTHSQHHNNNNIYAPMSSSSDTHNNFASIPSRFNQSNGLPHHHVHNQHQDFLENSSLTSASSPNCHHNNNNMQMHCMCSHKLMYPNNNSNNNNNTPTRTKVHRPCPPTPDPPKPAAIPSTPPPPPPIQQPCPFSTTTINRQTKPPVPSVRSLPKSQYIINHDQQININNSVQSEKLEDLNIEILSLDTSIKPQLSPLPKLKEKIDDGEFSTGPKSHERCSERAYMRFMEHHYESTSKYLQERQQKILKLESEYKKWPNVKKPPLEDFHKELYMKESINLRLKRQKMTRDDFDVVRLIGRGVIGKLAAPTHPK